MWNTLNLYYHGSDKNKVITNEITPIIEEMKEKKLIEGFYFIRHWVKGPHLRLNFKCGAQQFNQQVVPLISNKLNVFLKHQPSEDIKEDEIIAHYRELAKMEVITEDIVPFEKNNTLKISTYDTKSLLGEKGLLIKEEYCSKTYDLVIELLTRFQNHKSKLLHDLIYIMLICITSVDDMRLTYLSFRSHSESMLNGFDKNKRLRDRFEQQYIKNQSFIKSIINNVHNKELNDDFLVQWSTYLNQFYTCVKNLVEQGKLRPPLPEDTEHFYREYGLPKNWIVEEMSDFHNMLYSRKAFDAAKDSTSFKSLRIMLNVLYITFGQVGLKPVERYYLCYLVANGVEDFFNTTWEQQLKNAYGD